jgi:hypothetical protein
MEKSVMVKQIEIELGREKHLETEKKNLFLVLTWFFDNFVEDIEYVVGRGRPAADYRDIIKSLLIMTYHGMSYRRCQSDLKFAYENEVIDFIPKRSVLCKYMNSSETRYLLSKLIQQSAMCFSSGINTLIIDSTWYGTKMYVGGYANKPASKRNKNVPPLGKCRKLHIGIIRESKLIAFAITSAGTVHDSVFFKKIVSSVLKNGFVIDTLLADAAYLSKDNYRYCEEKGIRNIFIDFKSNITGKRAHSQSYKKFFSMYKNDQETWHEFYRFRVVIEGVYSVIKKKFMNWLRTKNEIAMHNEMLLKALCYNFTILGTYIRQLKN